jgi:transcriptional regulator with XRE-family HTH domain
MDIRERILQLCTEHQISIAELALLACLSQSTVNNITSGRNKSVTVNTIEQICNGLKISLADFFSVSRRPDLPPEVAEKLFTYEKQLMEEYNSKKP